MRIKLRTNPPSRPGSRHSISFLLVSLLASGMPAIAQVGGPAQVLTAADVTALITTAATALDDSSLAVAVVDRRGAILGVYGRPATPPRTPDIAVSLARTTAFFSNDQAPLSSRTVRFISGIHFPAGVPNTPPAALYGVENINRGCDLGPFNSGVAIPRPRSLAGTVGTGAGNVPLPCNPRDTRGCAVGGPIEGQDGSPIYSLGITTGKPNLEDSPNAFPATGGGLKDVDPGGIPLYRGGKLIGGIGVAGVPPDRAQYAALVAAAATGRGLTTALAFPNALPFPGAVFIDGIRLPFYGSCGTNLRCIQAEADGRPSGTAPGSFSQGSMLVPPQSGADAPEGYLIGPRGSPGGGLTRADVEQIVNQAIATADITRAQVRLPFGQTAKVIIAVTDARGAVLAEYRMADALFDAVDVVPSKARNAYYFSSREGYEVLRDYVERSTADDYTWEPEPPDPQFGWALTSRTIGFGGQPLFPPGIDLEKTPTAGPWFDLFVYDTLNPCTEGSGPSRGGNRQFGNQNGITWFPGSAPLYKDGELVGGLGVSGDGIEQNDLITAGGTVGFEPPQALRVDNSVIRVGSGEEVRLPYLKFPRNPTQR
jgi:uncharacterized protein GlcG (DUF336 family)